MPSRQGYHQARPRLPGKHPRETGGLRLAPQIMIVKEWRRMDGCTGKSVKRSNIISTPHPQGAWKTETIMWVRFANSNYMESMDLLEELSAHKKSSTNQDGLKMIWINWPNFLGDASGVDCNIDTNSCISGWTEQRGLCIFAWGFFFCFFFCIFIYFYLLNETWEIFLHAGCNPVSTLPAHVFSVSRHFYIYWEFRLLLLFLKNIFGLPTVMDPSSVIRNFFFFVCFSSFVLLQIHLVFGHANLDICQVLWIRDSFVVPT